MIFSLSHFAVAADGAGDAPNPTTPRQYPSGYRHEWHVIAINYRAAAADPARDLLRARGTANLAAGFRVRTRSHSSGRIGGEDGPALRGDCATTKSGVDLLNDPTLNKSTAFTEAEKEARGIVGLAPDVTESMDVQLNRVRMQLGAKATDLERYVYLINLLDHNETLFYRTIMSDPAYFLPIVYAPAIGEACLKFGHIYRQARGRSWHSTACRCRFRSVARYASIDEGRPSICSATKAVSSVGGRSPPLSGRPG